MARRRMLRGESKPSVDSRPFAALRATARARLAVGYQTKPPRDNVERCSERFAKELDSHMARILRRKNKPTSGGPPCLVVDMKNTKRSQMIEENQGIRETCI